MSLPSYQVVVINPITGETSAIFDPVAFYDLRYSRSLNDIGTVVLTLPDDNPYRTAFVLDSFIEIYRTDPVSRLLIKEETYLTRLTHRFRENDNEMFIAGGMSLNQLLARRIIDPDDDPLQAGGFSTKAGTADQVIRDYCREQIGDLASTARSISELTIPAVAGIGSNVGGRLRHEILFNAVRDFALRGNVDFTIERTSGNLMTLNIAQIGTDKTRSTNYPLLPFVGLSPDRGNLSQPSLMLDRKEEGTFIYALAQGQRENRYVLKTLGEGATDSPWNRIEFTHDVRNIKKGDALGVLTQARVALRNKQAKIEFSFEPQGIDPGNIYRQDWDIGDKVTALWGDDEFDLRIISVEINVSEGGENISVKVEPL